MGHGCRSVTQRTVHANSNANVIPVTTEASFPASVVLFCDISLRVPPLSPKWDVPRVAAHCGRRIRGSYTITGFLLLPHPHKEQTVRPIRPQTGRRRPLSVIPNHENTRVPGKGHSGEVWSGRSPRADGGNRRGSGRCGPGTAADGASGVVVKAQIHAGGRGKGGGVKIAKSAEEAGRAGVQDAGHEAGHAPDRARRQEGPAAADRRDAAHRARALSRHRARPRQRAQRLHGIGRGRHGDRRGRGQRSQRHHQGAHRARHGHAALPGAQDRLPARARRQVHQRRGEVHDGAGTRRRRHRRLAGRDQSVHHHHRRAAVRARRQDELRRQRALSPSRDSGPARHHAKKIRSRSKPASTASTTSSSTATWAAW